MGTLNDDEMNSVELESTSVIERKLGLFLKENKVIILIFQFCIQLEFRSKHIHIQTQEVTVQMVLVPLSLIHLLSKSRIGNAYCNTQVKNTYDNNIY